MPCVCLRYTIRLNSSVRRHINRPMPSPIIIALDCESAAEALEIVERLGPEADHYKVGLQLLTEVGPDLIRTLVQSGKHIFLDLKLHEIPISVAGAVKAAGKLGVSLVTVHASGGSAVLRSAVVAAKPFQQLKILALTVVTSLTDADLPEIGVTGPINAQVSRLALLAANSGCHGVVASAQEAARLRSLLPKDALIVCPGIQLNTPSPSDHARLATPRFAANSGASHVIIGRAITAAQDPVAAFHTAQSLFRSDG